MQRDRQTSMNTSASQHDALLAFVVCWLTLFSVGCFGDASPDHSRSSDVQNKVVDASGHQQMLDKLRDLSKKTSESPFLGDAEAKAIEALFSRLDPSQAATMQAVTLRILIAQKRLRFGDTDVAIEHFKVAKQILDGLDESSIPENSAEIRRLLQFQLGVAFMRQAETQNCVHCQSCESCILPIQGDGLHQQRQPAIEAMSCFADVLKVTPEDVQTRWLYNLAAMTIGMYPDNVQPALRIDESLFESEAEFPKFRNISSEIALDELSLAGGVIIDDFNGDDRFDIMTSNWHTNGQLKYYENDGLGSFKERTNSNGLEGLFGGLNLIQADYDNDGDLDVLVLRGAWYSNSGKEHPNSLLQNDGNGKFRDVTIESGIGIRHEPCLSADWADIDNDGDLDLFIGNESFNSQLFENNGDGTFTDIAKQAGVLNRLFVRGVSFGDFDGDRYPDLYISNYTEPNRLYRNNRDGTFTDVGRDLRVAGPLLSFPTWFWDFNNDGHLDIYVSGYDLHENAWVADLLGKKHQAATDRLYQNDGKGGFKEVSKQVGVNRVTLPMGANFGDLDNDGFLDYYLGTGFTDYEALMPNRMFHNRGGTKFQEVTMAGGFGHLQKGHGIAFADLDQDGDQDVFSQLGGSYGGDAFQNAVYENPGFENHWLIVRLVGKTTNRSAIGARIRVVVKDDDGERSIYRWVNSGGSFGANPLRQHIGIGTATTIERLEIYWPTSDATQTFRSIAADQYLVIEEHQEMFNVKPYKSIPFKRNVSK